MARLESEKKGGFYPTPPEEMELILKRITCIEGDPVTLIDPCCGTGDALKQWQLNMMAKGSVPTSYGIEIEKSRAVQAEKIVDYISKAGYEETRMSHHAFSAMYLNPPFMQMNGERMENRFLRDLTDDYLQPGGLLIFNIPQYILKDCAKILASRFSDIKVYRFTDSNFSTFKQVIVYGIRRHKGLRSATERSYQVSMEESLKRISFYDKNTIPSLDVEDEVQYSILTNQKPVAAFQCMKVEEGDILRSLQFCTLHKKVTDKLRDENTSMGQKMIPAMPLKITHVATAIASGALPEEMGDHLLVGISKPVQDQRIRINPKSGKEEEVTTFKSKSIVRIFSEKGIFNLK